MTEVRTIGRTDYRRYCAALGLEPDEGLSPAARASALPPLICDALIATPAAHRKLASWATGTRSAPSDAVDTLQRLRFFGDGALAQLTARMLVGSVPPPVAQYAVEKCTWVALGVQLLGFCSPRIPQGNRPFLIVVAATNISNAKSALQFQDLIAHELSHAWLLDEPASDVRSVTAFQAETLMFSDLVPVADAAVLELVNAGRRESARREAQAKALARAWGFNDVE